MTHRARSFAFLWASAEGFSIWPRHACAFSGRQDGISSTDILAAFVAETEDIQRCQSLCIEHAEGECWLYRQRCSPVFREEFDCGRVAAPRMPGQRPYYPEGDDELLKDGSRALFVDDVAFGYELLVNRQGLGARLFGVRASQDPVTLALLQEHLWDLKPDLVVEIGTECGGLASIVAELQELSSTVGHVLTLDISPQGYAPWVGPPPCKTPDRAHTSRHEKVGLQMLEDLC
ncbi:unnamed protein product [Symbiodinium microadriaticum]|nr:unnamed protein product [Symbiodinium microadriaticum]